MADIKVDGITPFNYHYLLNNTEDYQNYTFLTSSEIWGFEYPRIVVNGSFGGGYKLDGFVLHALKNEDLSQGVREELLQEEGGKGNLSSYFQSAPLATSDILLPVSVSIEDSLELNNVTVFLRVDGIEGKNLSVSKLKTYYGYLNGTSEEVISSDNTESAEADLLTVSGQISSMESVTDSL